MDIKVSIDDGGLRRKLSTASESIKKRASKSVRSTSFSVEKRVKNEMPWRTGRARACWGHWTPEDIVITEPEQSESDAIWEEKDNGLTIIQGTNVPYVVYLNQGSSSKAPAAFIDKAAEAGARELTKILQDEIGDLL